jgi:hypothetical protein
MPEFFQVPIHVLNQNEHNPLYKTTSKSNSSLNTSKKTSAINEIMSNNHKVNLEKQQKREEFIETKLKKVD